MKSVREGYKMAELGEIPEEWQIKKLGEIADINPKKEVLNDDTTISFIAMEDVSNNGRVINSNERLYGDVKKGYTGFRNNDVLLAKITPCFENGKRALVKNLKNKVGFGSTEFHVLRETKLSKANYLYYVIGSYIFKNKAENNMTGSAGQKRVPTDFVREYILPIPPLKEQEKIASILSTVDEQIDNVEKLIEKNKELKKGLMQKLLTKGIGHNKFKKTELGEIPEDWEVKNFKDITDILRCGVASTPTYVNQGIPFLSAQNVNNEKLSLHKYNFISEEYHKQLTKNDKPKKGDILYSRVGANYGIAAIVDIDFEFSVYVSLTLIRVKDDYSSNFYKYLLNSSMIRKQADIGVFQGGGVPNLNVKVVEKFKIVIPRKEEQEKIALILLKIDEKIYGYENKKKKLENIKKGLMQKLLTGDIRVI